MSTPILVLYHAECIDGFGAAFAAWRRFGDRAVYRPLHYGRAWSAADFAGREVFILDASYPRAILEEMAGVTKSLRLLDHHSSAREEWQDVLTQDATSGLWNYRDPVRPLSVTFAAHESGSRMAWQHFHPGLPLPRALAHIEDQDLWRFAIDGTRAFCRALRVRSFDFAVWDTIVCDSDAPADGAGGHAYRALISEGEAIGRFFEGEVARLAGGKAATVFLPECPAEDAPAGFSPRSVRGLAINTHPIFASELGHLLAEKSAAYGLIWHVDANGLAHCSLRATGLVNVARMAAAFGGGGHANAAGFRIPVRRFLDEVLLAPPPPEAMDEE